MSDRVVVMQSGRVMQIGSPREIYEQPQSPFVADFVGRINMVDAPRPGVEGEYGGALLANGQRVECCAGARFSSGQSIVLGVRPDLTLQRQGFSGQGALAGHVTTIRYAGACQFVTVQTPFGLMTAQASRRGHESGDFGAKAEVHWLPGSAHVWRKESL
jgi:ABC-type Fe3+/spermidine/putrescine transport system ATPase subunit